MKEEVAGIVGGPLWADWFVAASFVARHVYLCQASLDAGFGKADHREPLLANRFFLGQDRMAAMM